MSEHWVQDCKEILDRIKTLEGTKDQDRLDLVRTIRFILFALQRSVSGWAEWVNNPDVMARFSLEELKEISSNLTKLTQSFVEYDCQITARAQNDLKMPEPEALTGSTKKPKDNTDIFYVK